MIKTIYFEMGNVLVFFDFSKMLNQVADCTGLSVDEVHTHLLKNPLREKYEKGTITTEQIYSFLQSHAPKKFTLAQFTHAFSDIFTPNTELWPLVSELKEKGIRLILLSNTSESHYHFINSHYPILSQFDHKILSYELGFWKPDKRIFKKALEYAQCKRSECFYIDDVPEFIQSAREVGLPGTVFTDVPTLRSELIKSLVPLSPPLLS